MADHPEIPKILDELSKGSAKAGGQTSRQQRNARRRVLLALALFLPILAGIIFVGYQQNLMQQNISDLSNENRQLNQTISNQNILINQLQQKFEELPALIEIDGSVVEEVLAPLNTEILALEEKLVELESQLSTSLTQPSLDWKLLEAEFLVQIANRKLQLEGDVSSALILLEDADSALVQSGNNAVFMVRQSIANDLSSLRSIEIVDREGTYISLSNLISQIDQIDLLTSMQEDFEALRSQESSFVKLDQEYNSLVETTVNFLRSVFVWRKWEENPANVLALGQESTIKQSLRLMLEQALFALVSMDSELYDRSLLSSRIMLARYGATESRTGGAISNEIDELSRININPSLPNLNETLTLMTQLTLD